MWTACEYGLIDDVEYYISHLESENLNINSKDNAGNTPLILGN